MKLNKGPVEVVQRKVWDLNQGREVMVLMPRTAVRAGMRSDDVADAQAQARRVTGPTYRRVVMPFLVAFVIFLVLKLTGDISWDWGWVLAPLWAMPILGLIAAAIMSKLWSGRWWSP